MDNSPTHKTPSFASCAVSVQSRSLYPALVIKKELYPVAGVQALHDIATQDFFFSALKPKAR